MGKFKDLTGLHFHSLTVIEQAGRDKYGKILWRCVCDCGNETITLGRHLVNGHCKSCGCLNHIEKASSGKYKGLSKTRIFTIWKGMHYRCESENCDCYNLYGGRGVKVCNEWTGTQGFFEFLRWSLENGYAAWLSIDRIDNSGDYTPTNCRWVDWVTQANNRRKPDKVINQYGIWNYREPLPEPYREEKDRKWED